MTDDAILQVRGLRHRYPGSSGDTLAGIDLTIRSGRRLALLGANGAGKTTLLLHLNGSLRPTAGDVLLDGVPVRRDRAGLAAWRRRVGLVMQDADDQLFAGSVFEDVSFGPLNIGLDDTAARDRVTAVLHELRIEALADRPPHLLSHGQRKRVALAGVVAMQPELLILDEPTAGLDHQGERHLLAALRRLHAAGTTVIFTTHDVDLAYAWADEVAVFAAGKTLAQGPAGTLLRDLDLLREAKLRTPWMVALQPHLEALGRPIPADVRDLRALSRLLTGADADLTHGGLEGAAPSE